jgi:hypothetical protein
VEPSVQDLAALAGGAHLSQTAFAAVMGMLKRLCPGMNMPSTLTGFAERHLDYKNEIAKRIVVLAYCLVCGDPQPEPDVSEAASAAAGAGVFAGQVFDYGCCRPECPGRPYRMWWQQQVRGRPALKYAPRSYDYLFWPQQQIIDMITGADGSHFLASFARQNAKVAAARRRWRRGEGHGVYSDWLCGSARRWGQEHGGGWPLGFELKDGAVVVLFMRLITDFMASSTTVVTGRSQKTYGGGMLEILSLELCDRVKRRYQLVEQVSPRSSRSVRAAPPDWRSPQFMADGEHVSNQHRRRGWSARIFSRAHLESDQFPVRLPMPSTGVAPRYITIYIRMVLLYTMADGPMLAKDHQVRGAPQHCYYSYCGYCCYHYCCYYCCTYGGAQRPPAAQPHRHAQFVAICPARQRRWRVALPRSYGCYMTCCCYCYYYCYPQYGWYYCYCYYCCCHYYCTTPAAITTLATATALPVLTN